VEPTPADQVAVAISLSLATDSASISSAESTALLATVAATVGVDTDQVVNFKVNITRTTSAEDSGTSSAASASAAWAGAAASPASRAAPLAGVVSPFERRLSSFAWSVSFQVVAELSALTSADAFAAATPTAFAESVDEGRKLGIRVCMCLSV
jgi:hypothetical protein